MDFDPSFQGLGGGGSGFTGVPGVVTGPNGTVAGGMGPGATTGFVTNPVGGGANANDPGPSAPSGGLLYAFAHPTTRQVIMAVAIVLAVVAWRGHLRSLMA